MGNQKGVHLSRKPQRTGLIAEETPTNAPAEYANFADVLSFTLGSMIILSSSPMPTDSSNHLSHPQVLLSFSTRSRTGPFGYMSIIEAPKMFPAMSISMAGMVIIAMTGLTL